MITASGQTGYSSSTPNNVLLGPHTNLLAELSQSMYAFQRAMEQLGLSKNVAGFTASDFGRTFLSNGRGAITAGAATTSFLAGRSMASAPTASFPSRRAKCNGRALAGGYFFIANKTPF